METRVRIRRPAARLAVLGAFASTIGLAVAVSACKPAPHRGPPTEVKLNPLSLRLAPELQLGPLGHLTDKDARTSISLAGPARLSARFASPVEIQAVKVLGARNIRIEAQGKRLEQAEEGGEGWRRLSLHGGEKSPVFELRLTPLGADASLSELEVWGRGRPPAPRRPSQLASSAEAGAFENLLRVPLEPPSASLDVADSERCAELRFGVEVDSRLIRRAFLAYSGPSLKRPVVLSRSLNGHIAVGGFWMGPTSEPRMVVDELNPTQLLPQNSVSLCLPSEGTAPVSLEGLAFLAELDDGTNLLDLASQAILAEGWDGEASTSRGLSEATAHFQRRVELDDVWLAVDGEGALQGAEVLSEGGWRAVSERQELERRLQPLALLEDSPGAEALRLSFVRLPRADMPAVRLSELRVAGSPVGPPLRRIEVTYPTDGEHFGHTAYVAGFVEGGGNGPIRVSVGGVDAMGSGTFGVRLSREESEEPLWPVEIVARFADGQELRRTLMLDRDRRDELSSADGLPAGGARADDFLFGAPDEVALRRIGPAGGQVQLGERVKLDVPPGALDASAALSIQRRRSTSVPRLDASLINVTAPEEAGYRFMPPGQKFNKPVRIHLPFEPALLPEGMAPEEIKTYYYDEATSEWLPLKRVAVHRASRTVESETSHFTFMINAVLVLPEHPGPVSFNPTSIKDLKAADASAGMELIEPPQANNQGTAQLSFPIRVPPGRGAFTPDVRLVYNSAGGNGWVGVGWDVSQSTVDVDTRFGVPTYSLPGSALATERGTERYLLDGQMLVEAASEKCEDGGPGMRFAPRAERDFKRIRRCGASPLATDAQPFYWEVTDKGGTVFIYGKNSGARLAGYSPGEENIARWHLERVVDSNGNLTDLHYFEDREGNPEGCLLGQSSCEPFRQLYLKRITYTGTGAQALSGGSSGPYDVEFHLMAASGKLKERADGTTSARTGFKMATRFLLDRITVSLKQKLIREYSLTYVPGDFGKSLLSRIEVKGSQGGVFYAHSLDYELKATQAASSAFSSPVKFEAQPVDNASISDSDEVSNNLHMFVGIAAGPTKDFSAGIKGGVDFRQQWVRSVLVDVNGDGLPDRLNMPEGAAEPTVQLNQATAQMAAFEPQSPTTKFLVTAPAGDPATSSPLKLLGMPDLGREGGQSYNVGLETRAALGVGFGLGIVWGGANTDSAILDADGDGLIDHASAARVAFQQERCDPSAPGCTVSEIPFKPGQVIAGDVAKQLLSDAEMKAAEAALKKEFHPEDTVLQWVAPFAGEISIDATIKKRLTGNSDADGVELHVYKMNGELSFKVDGQPPAQGLAIGPGDGQQHSIRIDAFPIAARERVYFRLTTKDHFAVRAGQPPVPIDEVEFHPVIRYEKEGGAPADLSLLEGTGAALYEFSHTKDFRVAGDPVIASVVGQKGTVQLTIKLDKQVSTDDVRLCLQRFKLSEQLANRSCAPSDTPLLTSAYWDTGTSQVTVNASVEAGDQLVLRQEADTPYDPGKAVITVSADVVEVCDSSGNCGPPQESIKFEPPVFAALHRPPAQPIKPWVVPTDGEYRIGGRGGAKIRPTPIWALITKNGQHFFKKELIDDTPTDAGRHFLKKGDQLTFEAHSDVEPVLRGWTVEVKRIVQTNQGEQELPVSGVPSHMTFDAAGLDLLAKLFFGEEKPLSGGYRGWRYGQWNGNAAFDEGKIGVLATKDYEGKSQQDVADQATERSLDDSSQESAVVRLFVPMVGAPAGVELRKAERLWMGPDGFSYIGKGVMHAGRKGGYAAGEPQGGVHGGVLAGFRLGTKVRSAMNQSFNVGVSTLLVLNGGASMGTSDGKTDLLDLNGDRVLDLVDPTGASLTNRAFKPGSKRVALPNPESGVEAIRHSKDFALTAGMGFSGIDFALGSHGKNRLVSTRVPSVGIGLGLSRQSTSQDLLDVNGDGLPDRLTRKGDDIVVYLNLGQRFASTPDLYPVSKWATSIDALAGFISSKAPELSSPVTGSGRAAQEQQKRRGGLADSIALATSADVLRHNSTMSFSENLGVGISTTVPPPMIGTDVFFGISKNFETSLSKTPVDLIDLTGDGLPDYVKKGTSDASFLVQVNLGHGFSTPIAFAAPAWTESGRDLSLPCFRTKGALTGIVGDFLLSLLGQGKSLCSSPVPRGIDTLAAYGVHTHPDPSKISGGAYFSIVIPLPYPFLIINPGFDHAERQSGFELGMQDVDGDGFADHVMKTKRKNGLGEEHIFARINKLSGGNLLKKVSRPLGGSFELSYARVGNTVAMPESRFVLHKVRVSDGQGSGKGHVFTTAYEYQGGRFSRIERDFFGFATVKRKNPDGSTVEQLYRVDEVGTKGLLVSEETRDAAKNLFTRTVNVYEMRTPVGPVTSCSDNVPYPLVRDIALGVCKSRFAALKEVKREFYEGTAVAAVNTRQLFDYDSFGNVKDFTDEGDFGTDDDLIASIGYSSIVPNLAAKHIVGLPKSVLVKNYSGGTLRERTASYDANGNLKTLTSRIDGSNKTAVTTLVWKTNGNLESVIGPKDANSDSYTLTYDYDNEVNTYISSITDSLNLTSKATYDFGFGEVTETVDVAGNCTVRMLDEFGRLVSLHGPEDSEASSGGCSTSGKAPTLTISYFPTATAPHAITRHKLLPPPGSLTTSLPTLDTVVLMDGLARVVQTKKTAEVAGVVGFSVSGHLEFDEMGRVAKQGQAVFQGTLLSPGTYSPPPSGGPKNPTQFDYDLLGRTTKTVESDGSTTTVSYGFGAASGTSLDRFRSEVKDAEQNVRVVFRDVADRVVAVEERDGAGAHTTHYTYNPVGELTLITDAKGNRTSMKYDFLGRRTELDNPDTGLTRFTFDDAGNLTAKEDAKLRAVGAKIEYEYNFNRLSKVDYPQSDDVQFTYGAPGAPENGAGRVVQVVDESGIETRGYGKLGEIIRTTRLVSVLPGKDVEYTSRFSFDSFGRMLSLVYPDGEVLSYQYDRGGLLKSADGDSFGTVTSYLKSLEYDEFGQRVEMELGNGSTTTYAYQPLTRRLSTLATTLPSGTKLQNITYGYDKVGNVTSMVNALGMATKLVPGAVNQNFTYDKLYRLESASGKLELPDDATDEYAASFGFDAIHNMTKKVQSHTITEKSGRKVQHEDTNYTWTYLYGGPRPHAATQIGDVALSYDESGNTRKEVGAKKPREFTWSEDNWLREASGTRGRGANFLYDGAGERVVKRGHDGAVVYLGQFYSVRHRKGTKHVFAGQTRLASKTAPAPKKTVLSPGHGSPTPPGNGRPGHLVGIARACEVGLGQQVGLEPRCEKLARGESLAQGQGKVQLYWYHADHLGSTNLLTDEVGDVVEHIEYFPYGEAWREDGPHKPVSEVRFTGKLEDPETGLTYFGARYYDSRKARWVSPEPAVQSIARPSPALLSVYSYSYNSPVIWRDPDGTLPDLMSTASQEARIMCSLGCSEQDFAALRSAHVKASVEVAVALGATALAMGVVAGGEVALSSAVAAGVTVEGIETGADVIQGAAHLPAALEGDPAAQSAALAGVIDAATGTSPLAEIATANRVSQRSSAAGGVPRLHMGQQGKHILGHRNFIAGRSILTADPVRLAQRAGTGTPVGKVPRGQPGFRERIDFGEPIGTYVDPVTGAQAPTGVGIIHYGKEGIHIVPARPVGEP
ncbi:MAG: hypothetical protein HYZ28_18760 [Myxococcales bacterium]|nr:hypothetical protein [Myxococcales bacterium]